MRALLALPTLFFAMPAFAHHAMDGQLPNSLAAGFLSGLGHPIIGLDHLVFLLAAGLLAAPRQRFLLLPLAFILASLAGTLLHIQGIDLPGGEIAVALSVLALGLLLLRAVPLGDAGFAALLAVAGLFHGYAFGESIVGAETTPLLSYLVGLALIQFALCAGAALVWRKFDPAQPLLARRLAGAVAGLTGIAFLALNLAG
ncbi:HupE/UreJ family protein [Ferrovibrio sp.]|uniref:HupE/UreJ family protein n=1 Tax=Ferrovibrio sp. TaxID=1917215 RepID=UPI001B43481A|nr:HupE/UreJ family protein [Ferrovibrio sp.]MBP7062627.1 HupE/UreJ family protein [Ferrovibrio sp.]